MHSAQGSLYKTRPSPGRRQMSRVGISFHDIAAHAGKAVSITVFLGAHLLTSALLRSAPEVRVGYRRALPSDGMLCTVSGAGPGGKDARRSISVWGHRLTSACVAVASGMAVSQLSNTLGYKGLVGASVATGIVAGFFWLRRLPPRAPLLRYSFQALLVSAFVAVVAAFAAPSAWTAYLAFAAIGLTAIAASLTVQFLVSCAVLGGASTVGAGVAIISDGLALAPRVTSSPVVEPLVKTPEPIIIMAAGALTVAGGVGLIAVRGTGRVAPLLRVGIIIVVASLVSIVAGRSSSADMTLVPAGLAIGGFGIVTISVAGLLVWSDIKTLWVAIAVCVSCGAALIAFDLYTKSGWETPLAHTSMISLGSAAVVLGIALCSGLYWLAYLAHAVAGLSIVGLGVTVLMHPYLLLGRASIESGVAAAALGVTILWFIVALILMGLFADDGRGKRMLKSLISG